MTGVSAPSRLHFGLLNTGHVPEAPRFGGCGLMIDTPGVLVRVEPAREWSSEGPNAERALEFAKRVTSECHRVVVDHCPPEHVGLGVGTSLGLAVAKAIRPDAEVSELARLTGRGLRSGVGLWGFAAGGFIVDGGKESPNELPRLVRRLSFPADWRIVLARPPIPSPWYGSSERQAFAQSTVADPTRLHRDLVRTMAEIEHRIETGHFNEFAEAVYQFNREGGRWFEAAQGGVYAAPAIAGLIERIRKLGFAGVGQTSWGPTVFTFTADREQAEWLAQRLREISPELHIETAAAANHGAVVTQV